MSDRDAKFIIKTIKSGNDVASIALLKTFGLVKLVKAKRPEYKWDFKSTT